MFVSAGLEIDIKGDSVAVTTDGNGDFTVDGAVVP